MKRLDQEGVGELVKIAVERGRAARPGLKLGICGEHGGDPASIRFCARVGLDYVSCSPYRVPIARLAAAQAALAAPERQGHKAAPSRAIKSDRHQRVLLASGRRSAAARVSVGKTATRGPTKLAKPPVKKKAAAKPPAAKKPGAAKSKSRAKSKGKGPKRR